MAQKINGGFKRYSSVMGLPPPPEDAPLPPPPRIRVTKRRAAFRETSKPLIRKRASYTRNPRRGLPRRKRRRGFLILRIVVVLFLLLLLALILVPQLRDSPLQWFNPLSYRQFPEEVEFTVQRKISITGVQSFEVDMPKPKNLGGAQWVLSDSYSPEPDWEQRYGYDWMSWDLPGGEEIAFRFTMRTKTIWWDIDSVDSLTLAEARQYDSVFNSLSQNYNHDEWKIEVSDPEVIMLARQLEVEGGTVYDHIVSVYKYLDINFEYSTREGGSVKSSSETLRDKRGDCDDTSFLFVALLRAMGIPAWPELGAMYNSLTNQWVGHGWLEVYVPTTEGGKNVTIDIVNDEFFIRGANRFSDFKSDGDGDHLMDYYYSYAYLPIKLGDPEISDEFVSLNYDTFGTVTVKLGSDGRPLPNFELLLLVPAVAVAILVCMRIKRHDKHPS